MGEGRIRKAGQVGCDRHAAYQMNGITRLWMSKSAAASRALMRAGKLPGYLIDTLRMKGVLPEAAQYAAGIERGNQNLIRKLGLIDDSAKHPGTIPTNFYYWGGSERYGEPRAPNLTLAGVLPISEHMKISPRSWWDHYERLKSNPYHLYSQFHSPGLTFNPSGISKSLESQWGPVVRRHEIDEARSTLNFAKRYGSPPMWPQRKPWGGEKFRQGFSHTTPMVLREEGRNLSGMSPELQSAWREIRDPEIKRMHQFGITDAGAYSVEKASSVVRLKLVAAILNC